MLNADKYQFFQKNADYISSLPAFEQSLIDYFMNGIKQKEVAKTTGLTQGAISSRLKRAQQRIEFFKELKSFNIINIEQDLKDTIYCSDPVNLLIIKNMASTTCQSETARKVNNQTSNIHQLNQVKVRHRYEKCLNELRDLKQNNPKYLDYYRLMTLIKENLYKSYELKSFRRKV